MGDFFVPNPGGPAPPPEPDIPPPDFKQAGQGISEGLVATDMFGKFFLRARDWAIAIASTLLAWFIKASAPLVVGVLRTMTETDEKTQAAYGQVASATLSHIFGVDIEPALVAGRGQRAERVVVADTIGKAVLGSLFQPGFSTQGGALLPSSAASESYLNTVVHMGLEGWFESWIFDALSYHELEKFGDLKDTMAEMLGLGRLTRRVLAPPLKILVEDPYTWKLNDTYRPALLTHDIAVRQFLRGDMQRDELDQVLGWQGFKPKDIDRLINHNSKALTDAEVDYALERQIVDSDGAIALFQSDGWTNEQARLKVGLLIDKRIDGYRKQMIAAATTAFVQKDIEIDEFQTIVQSSGLPDLDQTWIIKVAGLRREMQFKRLTLAEIERLIKAGIDNVDDLRAWMVRENYRLDEMDALELLLIQQVQNKADAAKAKADQAAAKEQAAQIKAIATAKKEAAVAAQAATKGTSLVEAKQLVKDGRWTFDQYSAFLVAHGASQASVTDLVGLLHDEIDKATAAQAVRDQARATAAEKEIPLAQYEAGVKSGVFSIADFQKFLVAQKYGAEDIASLVALLQSELDAAKLKAGKHSQATTRAATKSINLPQLERAVRLGLTPIGTYQAALVAAGEDQTSVDLLTGILADQVKADQATAARRQEAALRAGQQGLSLAQTEQAVINGIRPMSDYTLFLGKLGVDQVDVDALRELLQLRLDHQADAADKQAQAEAKASATGLSLAAIQRATKLGVLTVDQYTAILGKIGLTADDQAILRTSMLVELQKQAAANTTRTSAASKLAKQGLSLATQESAVINGVEDIAVLQSNLVAAGLADADVSTLVDLVTLKRDQAQAAAGRRAIAEQRAADKDPSLAKEEALVTAGVLTMDDYAAYLREIGMDDLDVADLVDLLSQKIADAQAKAAAAATAPPPGAKPRKKKKAAVAPVTTSAPLA